jgi:hypothetical protein
MKTKLSMMASIAILFATFSQSQAYFNDDRFGIAEQPRMVEPVNAYSYYKEGVSDVVSQLKKEINDSAKSNYVSSELNNKILVVKEVTPGTTIEQVVFFKSIGKKMSNIQPVVLKSMDTGKVYVLFSFFSQEQPAHELNEKLNNFNVGSTILHNKENRFGFYNYLQEKINPQDDQFMSNPVRVVTIEKIRYINQCETPIVNSGKTDTLNYKVEEIKPAVAPRPKAKHPARVAPASTRAAQMPKAVAQKPKPTQEELDRRCLGSVVKTIKQKALFNLETLQFKHKNKIYGVGDTFVHGGCQFKIKEVWREDFNFFIKFADVSNEALNAKIAFPQGGNFLTQDKLFFDPAKAEEDKTIIKATPKAPNSNGQETTPIKVVVEQNQPSAPTEQSSQTQAQSASNSHTNSAKCDFRPLSGIRTQLIKKADGSYKTEPIYNFYKGKVLPVDYYEQNGYIVVFNPQSQAMIIEKENFARSCKL